MKGLKDSLIQFNRYLIINTEKSSQQINLFAFVMMINFPLFGLVWELEQGFYIEDIVFRSIAVLLCVLLASNRFWPSSFFKLLPIVWYLALLFCLPFFFSYLTLVHHLSTIWLMNCVSAVFFLFLVTRVFDALILILLGFGLAFLIYLQGANNIIAYVPGEISLFSLVITFSAAMIIGALFARDREVINDNRIAGMRLLAGSLAHDLRTYLASIHLQAELQESIVEKLSQSELQRDLKYSLDKIIRGIEMGNQLISMQLNNIQHEKFETKNFQIQSINRLLEKTLDEYPLKEQQKSLIETDLSVQFSVWIEGVAFKNLIWNLLKNSLDCIEESGKGSISIWLSSEVDGDDFNYLHIKDTAKGLYPKQADKIFESFYSDRKGGTGVGLGYCKLLMKAAGGDIYCKGKFNQYAHFTVKFPKID